MDKSRRTVVEVHENLRKEIRKIALLNDLRIYEFTNAIIEEFLRDQDNVKKLLKKLKL